MMCREQNQKGGPRTHRNQLSCSPARRPAFGCARVMFRAAACTPSDPDRLRLRTDVTGHCNGIGIRALLTGNSYLTAIHGTAVPYPDEASDVRARPPPVRRDGGGVAPWSR